MQLLGGNLDRLPLLDLGVGGPGNVLLDGLAVDKGGQAGAVKAVRASRAPDVALANLLLGQGNDLVALGLL